MNQYMQFCKEERPRHGQRVQVPGAMNTLLDRPSVLTGAPMSLNVQEGLCSWKIQ